MTTRKPLVLRALFLAFGLLLVHAIYAADSTPAVPTDGKTDRAQLSPGTKYIVRADIECEVCEIKDDTVFIRVTALREAEQGVQMLDKLPHTNRLFRNVGVARTETDVILAIPQDRIAVAPPKKNGDTSSEVHLQQAVGHLKAAGLDELAKRVDRYVQRQARKRESAEKHEQKAGTKQREASPDSESSDKPVQVLVEMKIVELSRSKLRAQGTDFHIADNGEAPTPSDTKARRGLQAAMTSCVVEENAPVLQLLDRLWETGVAKVLAEPTVVTMAGRPASFHSGGEFPVPMPQSDGQVATEYREFGTHVDLMPVHLGDGKLRLELHAVVSELDTAHSVTIGDKRVPGLRTRSVDTTVEMTSGQTVVISGLVQTRPTDCKHEQEEIELLLIATPRLVDGH